MKKVPFIGQKVRWRLGQDIETIHDWRYNEKNEIEIQVKRLSVFWNIWFFEFISNDGNNILKELVNS